MKQNTVSIVVTLVTFLFLIVAGLYGFTIVKIEDAEMAVQNEAFDPVAYVDAIWTSKMLPTFTERAVELSTILSEVQTDASGVISKESLIPITNKYGLITDGEAHVYMVKGSGKIASVDIATSQGTVEVTLDSYNGPIKVLLYVGTRLPSDDSSVRDAVGFITLGGGDFKDQTEYGKAASEINKRVISQVLNDVDRNNLMGKTVFFIGAFTIRTQNIIEINLTKIKIAPVEIKLGE